MKKLALLLILPALLLVNLFWTGKGAPGLSGPSVPKRYDLFFEEPVTACRPEGWIREFLSRQRSGLTGHPEVLSYPFNSVLWAGTIVRENETHGDNWWRYEQTAYYTDGLLRLGYLLGDSALVKKAREGIYFTLSHPQKSGRLGPELFASQWPIAVFFRAIRAEYEATGDPRIIEALHRHYLSYAPETLGNFKRAIVNIEGVLWTYGKTGDTALLSLAERAYALGGFELNLKVALSAEQTVLHGVTYMEMAKLPVILYAYTGKRIYLDAATNAMKKLDRDHMLPDGVPSSSEFLAGKDPLNSHETCDISDYTWSLGYMLAVTGDATWADRLERAIFNAGPGAVSKDFKNLQYFSSVNQVIATGTSNHNKFAHGSTWMAYWPCHETECCAGNVHRFMPNYVARMWMRNKEGGPVAALYGPCTMRFTLPGNKVVAIRESTGYPFDEDISFIFNTATEVELPFTLRIPAWSRGASLSINGQPYTQQPVAGNFITIHRRFKDGDRIVLRLPMAARLVQHAGYGSYVERGPLVYSFPVPEKVSVDTATYPNLGGKRSPDPAFPALDIRPAGDWNYALAVDPAGFSKKAQVVRRTVNAYPFDAGESPVTIRVPARKVEGWTLLDGRYTPALPSRDSIRLGQKLTTITLVPYGSTRLRLTVFPAIQ